MSATQFVKIGVSVTLLFLFYTNTVIADWLYAVDRDEDHLLRIDPETQQSEIIGDLDFNYRYGGLAWHPESQGLFLVNSPPRASENAPTLTDFYWIDPTTAASQHVGTLDLSIQSSLVGYGVTIDNENRIYISFTDLETYAGSLYEISLEPLEAQLVTTLGSSSAEIDNLAYDPNSGMMLTVPSNITNPAKVLSIDLSTNSNAQKCMVGLPENFADSPDRGFNNGDLTFDSKRNVYWRSSLGNPLVQLNLGDECTSNPINADAPTFRVEAMAYVPVDLDSFVLNPGLNDAWYDPETSGQGFFITVFPDLSYVSLAWFTYDTELPTEDAQANLGDPGHRWLTAGGVIGGNKVLMNIEMTSGGIFDTPTDIQRTDPPGSDGTIILTFDSCNSGTVEYDITSINQQGIVPIQRVANDNIVICEALYGN